MTDINLKAAFPGGHGALVRFWPISEHLFFVRSHFSWQNIRMGIATGNTLVGSGLRGGAF